jgi:hypothetical protein
MAADRPGRAAWLAVGLVLAVLTVAYGTYSVASAFAYDAYDLHASFASPIHVVDVDAAAGGVRITGRDRAGATVDTHVIRGFSKPSVDVHQEGGRLVIRNTCGFTASWCSVMTRVHVDEDARVIVRASGGSARVIDVRGDLDLDASGGGVHVVGSSGSMRLHSSGGGVDATGVAGGEVIASASGGGVHLDFTTPPTLVDASSSGGGVSIVVPHDGTAYRVEASSSGGGTHNGVRTDPDGRRRLTAHSSGGGVSIRYPD